MNLDLVIASVVLFFALLGAFTGAAKQVAQLVGLVVAAAAARFFGPLLAPEFGKATGLSGAPGSVGAAIAVFVVGLVITRLLVTVVLRRLFGAGDPEQRSVDRGLGFLLGGAKVAAIAYVLVCGLAFVESNVVVAGRKLGLSPKDSQVFALARRWNVFELTLFSGAGDLMRVAKAATDPARAPQLKDDPSYQALRKDPRFRQVLDSDGLKKALKEQDVRALLRSSPVLQLLQDPAASKKLAAVAQALR